MIKKKLDPGPIKFARKPFYVDAIRVTADNMEDVAEWCMGDVVTTVKAEGSVEEKYIRVRVHRPLTERQTKAFEGDWVLYAGTGFKVYTPRAFEKSFEKVVTLTKAQADEAGIRPPVEKKPMTIRAIPSEEINPKPSKTIAEEQAEFAAMQADEFLEEISRGDS